MKLKFNRTLMEDIIQCIYLIIWTPYYSVPHRPDFGSDTPELIDQPVNKVIARLRSEIYTQIKKFEPRIKLKAIPVEQIDINHIKVRIIGEINGEEVSYSEVMKIGS